MRLLAIVPAFNEARNLPGVIASIRAAAPALDICVIDDGSSDGTAEIAAASGAQVLRCPVNLGIGGAVQTGYRWAEARGYDVAVQLDGDGQHDPAFIEDLVQPIREGAANLVVGSRFLDAGGFRSTLLRRSGIRYLGVFLRVRCGARVTDATSGFRAADRRAIRLFAASYPSDYPEPEAIAVAVRAGLRLGEVPVRMRERVHGKSSITFLKTLYCLVKVSLALVLLPARGAVRVEERA